MWEFEVDAAQNFNFYFKEGNPSNLRKRKVKKMKCRPI